MSMFESTFMSIALCLAVALAAVMDIRTHKIPNLLTFPAMLFALCFYATVHAWQGFLFSLAGIGTGIALLILPWLMGGMGAGDAKLLGAVGGFLGAKATLTAFLYIALIGCLYAALFIIFKPSRFKGYFKDLFITFKLLVVTRKYIPDPEPVQKKRPRVYYGVAIAAGTICFVVLEYTGHQLIVV